MTLQEVIKRFNTTPFLFAGSGISRRYYNLPNWIELLSHFANLIKQDEFAFQYYDSFIPADINKEHRLSMIAGHIEIDFNISWFNNDPGIRSGDKTVEEEVLKGTSPFKAEIAAYLRSRSQEVESYKHEIEKLKSISKKNVSGIITTNYDDFFETVFDDYKTFIGQNELIFSPLQGIAEIYKIHGSLDDASTIVITENDYKLFDTKSKYLAAKLMTIFMEYPIIFIGYSLSDENILSILEDIVVCLPASKVDFLQKRFVFIEYDAAVSGATISSHSFSINAKLLEMTKITLSDFGLLYDALQEKKAALPVKVLRRFKDEIYTFARTSAPGTILQVADLNDPRIDEDMLALQIGLADTGLYGLGLAVDANQWYRNIVLQDLSYDPDHLLTISYPELAKQNSWKIPVWYYLTKAKESHPEIEQRAANKYDDIVSIEQIKRNKSATRGRNAKTIWAEEKKQNYFRAIRLLSNLPENKVTAEDLQVVLEEIFHDNPDILSTAANNDKSSIKRLIRLYDFLMYKKKKSP